MIDNKLAMSMKIMWQDEKYLIDEFSSDEVSNKIGVTVDIIVANTRKV